MAKETVIIGCKLPNGLILEVGYELSEHSGAVRGPNYQRIVLKGWNAHSEELRKLRIATPAGVNTSPFLNRNVDKAAWDEWKLKHKNSWLLKNEILFEAKDELSAAARLAESDKTPTPLAPLAKKDLPRGIEDADFAKERQSA